jgi:hypothetical protein
MNMIQDQLQAPCAEFQMEDISKFFWQGQKLLCSWYQCTMGLDSIELFVNVVITVKENTVQNLSDHTSLKSHYFQAWLNLSTVADFQS